MLPVMATLARMGRSEWLIKRRGKSTLPVRGGKRKGHGPYSLTLGCIYHWKGGRVPSSSLRVWSTTTFEAVSSGRRFSWTEILHFAMSEFSWNSEFSRRSWLNQRQGCICSIDLPNNSPDGDVATETAMRKHQDLSANLHRTTRGQLKDRIAHRIVKHLMYQSFATWRQIVHTEACIKCMGTLSAELHLNLMLQSKKLACSQGFWVIFEVHHVCAKCNTVSKVCLLLVPNLLSLSQIDAET